MNHPIVAAPWQLGRSLELILLPLVPEPEFDEKNSGWTHKDRSHIWCWKMGEVFGDHFYDSFIYKKDDRVFFQEPWCKGDWGIAFDDDIYFTRSTTPEAEHLGWQPADTMPPEAAQYWFEVTGVKVVQMKKLTGTDAIAAGMPQFLPEQGGSYASLDELFLSWNAAHPDRPWHGDRHIVALRVKPAILDMSKW